MKPITKFQQVINDKDEILKSLSLKNPYFSRKYKKASIYMHCDTNAYCFEIEHNKVLLIFWCNRGELNIQFCTKWTDDEVEEGDDDFYIPVMMEESEYFQQSLLYDMRFMDHELYIMMCTFMCDIQEYFKSHVDIVK